MAHLARRVAPAVLASFVVALTVAARAETPAAASPSDCLAKPGAPSAKGSHWYYRIERSSGRHCWYQHAVDPARHVPAHPHVAAEAVERPHVRAAAPTPAPVPANPRASEAPPALPAPAADTADDAANVVPPVASPPVAAPVNEPPAWPVASAATPVPPAVAPPDAPAAVPVDRVPVRSVESPPPAPEPKAEAPQPQLDPVLSKHPPARTVAGTRNSDLAEQVSHVPALLGAVSALVIIIIGSFAGRLLTQRQRRRPQAKTRPRDWQSPVSDLEEESPGLVPAMPGGGTAHAAPRDVPPLTSPDDFGLRRAQAPRPVVQPKPRRAAPTPPSRESTRVLEANVRELLHRLQTDLRGQAVAAAAAATPVRAPAEQELDAVLAMWRARRASSG